MTEYAHVRFKPRAHSFGRFHRPGLRKKLTSFFLAEKIIYVYVHICICYILHMYTYIHIMHI